jgi:hypothetical protein
MSRFVCAEHHRASFAGDRVALAVEGGHPEGMDDVRALHREFDRPADRHVHLVARRDDLARVRVGVVELPPPLAAGHLDLDGVLRRERRHRAARDHAEHEENEQRDDGDRRRAGDDPALLRVIVLRLLSRERHDERADDEHEHDRGHVDELPEERVDAFRLDARGARIEHQCDPSFIAS